VCEVNVGLTFQKSEVRRDSGGAHEIVYADVSREPRISTYRQKIGLQEAVKSQA